MNDSTKRYVSGGLALAAGVFELAVQSGVVPQDSRWTHFGWGVLVLLAAALPSFLGGGDAPLDSLKSIGAAAKLPSLAGVGALALLFGCAGVPGRWAYRAPDPAACARALPAVVAAQAPCDRSRPDPAACARGAVEALAAALPCLPVPEWVAP